MTFIVTIKNADDHECAAKPRGVAGTGRAWRRDRDNFQCTRDRLASGRHRRVCEAGGCNGDHDRSAFREGAGAEGARGGLVGAAGIKLIGKPAERRHQTQRPLPSPEAFQTKENPLLHRNNHCVAPGRQSSYHRRIGTSGWESKRPDTRHACRGRLLDGRADLRCTQDRCFAPAGID